MTEHVLISSRNFKTCSLTMITQNKKKLLKNLIVSILIKIINFAIKTYKFETDFAFLIHVSFLKNGLGNCCRWPVQIVFQLCSDAFSSHFLFLSELVCIKEHAFAEAIFPEIMIFFFSNLYLLEENIYTYMKSGYRNQHRIMVVNFMPHAIFRSCHQISILILLSATTVVIFCLNSWDKFSLFTFGGGDYCPLCDHILIRNLLLVTRIDIHLLKAGEHNR